MISSRFGLLSSAVSPVTVSNMSHHRSVTLVPSHWHNLQPTITLGQNSAPATLARNTANLKDCPVIGDKWQDRRESHTDAKHGSRLVVGQHGSATARSLLAVRQPIPTLATAFWHTDRCMDVLCTCSDGMCTKESGSPDTASLLPVRLLLVGCLVRLPLRVDETSMV